MQSDEQELRIRLNNFAAAVLEIALEPPSAIPGRHKQLQKELTFAVDMLANAILAKRIVPHAE